MFKRMMMFLAAALLTAAPLSPIPASAEEPQAVAGMAVGVTAGNMWFLPIKAISVVMGLTGGAVSFVLSGGNAELTEQIWRDTTEGPYLITPEVAQKAVGHRPELQQK
jgi:hypothetical protein